MLIGSVGVDGSTAYAQDIKSLLFKKKRNSDNSVEILCVKGFNVVLILKRGDASWVNLKQDV